MFVCSECGSTQPGQGHCPADGTLLTAIGEDLLLGTTVGAFRVARLLGIGGMGRVYKGVHPAIGSRVAIKVLSRECSDRRDLVERFFAEAKAVNLIRHESIVNVLDLAMLPDGRPYIIMEYLDGAPLASIIEHGVQNQAPLPLGGIARLTAEVLDALGAAHAKGIIHRDLKPDNIFVTPSGRAKVLDFGIAKLSDVSNTSTRTGSLLGTPHYMAPEQAAGRAVDHRADLYAIGVILFECATGRKPFVADALFDLLRMHVEAPPPLPRALRPDMPPAFEQVILTALAKPLDQRFASAPAMSMALQHATAQLPPEQWRPLIAPSAVGLSWAPTPPVSWPGPGSQPPAPPTVPGGDSHPPASPTVPMRGSPPPPPNLGTATTVSSGQVTGPARSSKKGLWIGLAIVLAGGGITAAALLAGGDDRPASTSSATSGRDPWGASTGSTATRVLEPPVVQPPEPPKVPQPPAPTTPSSADDDNDDEPPSTPPPREATSHGKHTAADPMTEAFAQLDETLKSLPADQQKRFAAYKGLSKLPPKERLKKLRELAKQGLSGIDLDAIPDLAASGADDDTPAERPPPGAAWITSHEIDPPSGFDPEHVDVSAFIPWAIAQARQAIPDAQLIRIDTNGVGPDGRANLKLPSLASDHGSIDVRFISPSRGKRDPSQPLGVARRDFKCMFRVEATPSGVEISPIDFFDCAKEHVVPPPRCSFAGIWKKAIAKKAPSHNAVGNVDYRSNGSRPVWYFAIGAGFDVAFSETLGDDCAGATAP